MEIKDGKIIFGHMKGQMFTLASLMFVLLMVATLLIFVIMGIGYNNLSSTAIVTSSATNYGGLLSRSAGTFAYASASTAMKTIFTYEFNSTMRQSNFVSNLSYFMRSLMVNGTMPNVTANSVLANTIQQMMGNATFTTYNTEISSVTGIGSKNIVINQTLPQITQATPYALNVKYTENVQINTSQGVYNFDIPVNVSLPINNTPDLFYAQQGIYKNIVFSNIRGLARVVGNDYATTGNAFGMTYGVVYQIPSGATGCGSGVIPAGLSVAPFNSLLILATVNAFGITGGTTNCANNYGGLITQQVDAPANIPYLVFSKNANVLQYTQTGQQLLLYGPGMSVINESGLISAVSTESYFTSPFTYSYLDRVSGRFQKQSPDGMFTLGGFDRQGGVFNALAPSYITTPSLPTPQTTYLTVSAWLYATSNDGNRGIIGQADAPGDWSLKISNTLCTQGQYDFVIYGTLDNCFGLLTLNSWQFVTVVYSKTAGTVYFYTNGQPVGSHALSVTLNYNKPLYIGQATSDPNAAPINFNGMMSNIQLYNATLSPQQIFYQYQGGIDAIPAAVNAPLAGWWTLNGNPYDLSGLPYPKTTATSMGYSLLPSYTRDAIFTGSVFANTYAVPGLLTCNNRAQCTSNSLPGIYLGDMPLVLGNSGLSVGYFNGGGANAFVSGIVPTYNAISVSAWIYPQSSGNQPGSQNIISSGNFMLTYNSLGLSEADYWINVNGAWQPVITYPLPRNQWYHIAGTLYVGSPFTPSLLTIYVNGVQANQITSSAYPAFFGLNGANTNTWQTMIGASLLPQYNLNGFNGSVSNIQVYNKTLSASEVSRLYTSGITTPPVDTKHLVGWWLLDGNSNDYSAYNNYAAPNGITYRLIQLNYSQGYFGTNTIGLSTPWAVSGEWQTIGFPSHP